jgi:hypothetical protein
MDNFTIIETILRDRSDFFVEIRDGVGLRDKINAMLLSSFAFLAIYGAVMGAGHSFLQAVSSYLKLPVLYLVTLLICVPSLHYFNILFGSRQTISQTIALILTAISTTSVLMVSLAPITLFFLLTSNQYQFFKLLNITFLAIASFLGVSFLRQGMRAVTAADDQGRGARRYIFFMWIFLYGFVGSQMAWTLRPFMGDPQLPFILFLERGGNFYADVASTIAEVLGF